MIHLTLIYALVAAVLAGVQRLLPMPWNLTMLGALALFAGARLRPWLGLLLPVVVWALTDLVLWQTRGDRPFDPYVCGSFLAYAGLGLLLLRRRTNSPLRIGGVCLLGSLQFFLVTNFGAWLSMSVDPASLPSGQAYELVQRGQYEVPMYARNIWGLLASYWLAIPFANHVIGDLLFCGVLFGGHALLMRWVAQRRQEMVLTQLTER
jgi:hypothetical protein